MQFSVRSGGCEWYGTGGDDLSLKDVDAVPFLLRSDGLVSSLTRGLDTPIFAFQCTEKSSLKLLYFRR